MRLRSIIVCLIMALGVLPVSAQNLYRLGINDRLEIWTSAEPSLQRIVVIGPDGRLSLPLVGHLQAAGLTVPDLEQLMQERLKGFFNEAIDLTVMLQPREEAAQTVYVTGHVTTPGAYPVRSGMILLHGISMAGGLRSDTAVGTTEQRLVEARGVVARHTGRIEALDAQIARINAELSGGDIPDDGSSSLAIARERQILTARRAEEAVLLRAHAEALKLRRNTNQAIGDQGTTHATRIELSEKRLDAIKKLVDKGFANQAQLFELQGILAELKARDLSLQVEYLNSQREIAAEISSAETALQTRQTQLQIELRDAQSERDETIALRADGMRILKLLADEAAAGVAQPSVPPTYTIVRTVDGQPVELNATELSEIQAGDIIRVDAPGHAAAVQQVSTRSSDSAAAGDGSLVR